MRNGAALAVAATSALAVLSGWSRARRGSRDVEVHLPAATLRKPSFVELAELVHHRYPLSEIVNVFPDHTSKMFGNQILVDTHDMGRMVVSLGPKGDPQMYRGAR